MLSALFEALSIIVTVLGYGIKAIFNIVIDNIPLILDLFKIKGYFTPASIIGLWIGVPTIVVSIAIWLIRKAIQSKQ